MQRQQISTSNKSPRKGSVFNKIRNFRGGSSETIKNKQKVRIVNLGSAQSLVNQKSQDSLSSTENGNIMRVPSRPLVDMPYSLEQKRRRPTNTNIGMFDSAGEIVPVYERNARPSLDFSFAIASLNRMDQTSVRELKPSLLFELEEAAIALNLVKEYGHIKIGKNGHMAELRDVIGPNKKDIPSVNLPSREIRRFGARKLAHLKAKNKHLQIKKSMPERVHAEDVNDVNVQPNNPEPPSKTKKLRWGQLRVKNEDTVKIHYNFENLY